MAEDRPVTENGPVTTVRPEPIGTSRLVLVPIGPGHADEMAEVLADPALYAFTGGHPPTPAELHDRYERLAAGSPDPLVNWGNWVIEVRATGRLAGYVQATITGADGAGNALVAELAWVIGPAWQGQGLASEAARALVSWLGRHGAGEVIAHIHPDHHASAAVAAAAGLSPAGDWHDGERCWRRVMTPGAAGP
jgi:RimJ/RimL family protein N-acetyltransferase